MNVKNYSGRVHMAWTHELASESQPYERVPNILRFSFNNLFITCIDPKVRNGRFVNAFIPDISSPDRHFIWPHFM